MPGKNLCQLDSGQLRQRVVGVDDHRDTIQGNDLLGGGTVEVTQGLQLAQLNRLDRTGGGSQFRLAGLECGKTGTGSVGGDIDAQGLAVTVSGTDLAFVGGVATDDADGTGALLLEQACDQRRCQRGTDGVGALDTQLRLRGSGANQREQAKHKQGEVAQHAVWHSWAKGVPGD